MTADEWIRTMKSPRPVSIAAWFRMARRGDWWWPGKTFTVDLSDEPDDWNHRECGDCGGSGRCGLCLEECLCDDVVQCEWCDGSEACPSCEMGWIYE